MRNLNAKIRIKNPNSGGTTKVTFKRFQTSQNSEYKYNANMTGTKGLNLNHSNFIVEISDTLIIIHVFRKKKKVETILAFVQ